METVTFTIDGKEITVPKGTLIIRAAEQLGTIVPRFCDHPLLDPVGACRQCIVEVEGAPKPMMACTTEAGPDMVVKTHLTSPMARKGQEGTLEFLLMNHPLDCPMCDKGGECPLQDQALTHGSNSARFIEQKRRYDKPVAISSQILLDRERCVLCARCTRFAEQIAGDPFIELYERGGLEQVAIYEDEPFHSYFSGNIIQICPVGALTSTAYRFKARPFDVVTTPSVCDHCSAGCTLTVQSRRGEIQRQLARTNMAVNEAWNCDKGRFGFRHLTAATRVTSPLMRDNGELVEASWIQALKKASAAIAAANAEGPGRVAVLTGGRLADEDAYAVSKYARSVLGTDDVDFRTRFAAASETNELAAVAGSPTATYADIEASDVIVVAGIDPEEEVPILYLRLRKAWRNHRARIVVVGPHQGTLADIAWRHVPTGVADEAATLAGLLDAGDGAGADAADALAAAQQVAVVVGERAGAGSITAGRQLASNAAGDNDPVFAYVARRSGARGAIDAGLVSGLLPGGRLLTDESDRGDVAAVWGDLPSTPGRDLHAILADAAAGKIDVLHLIGVDISRDVAASALGRKALEKAGTVIVQDLALTDTAQLADVVLPATARQERAGTATNFEGRAQAFQRAVDAAGLALDDWEIIRQLSAVLGKDLGFDDLAGIRAEMDRLGRRPEPHAHHESVEQSSVEQSDSTATGDEAGAATDAESDSAATAAAAADADGVFAAVVRPLLLDNGTMLTGAADLLATARVAAAQIAPEDAAELGISDGQQLKVNVASGSGNGSVELVAEVTRAVAPGFLALPANSTAPAIIGLVGEDGQLAVTVEALTARDEEVA